MAKPKIKESDIRANIRDYLRYKGWFVYYNLQGLGCYPGLPDMCAVKGGKVVHLEIKTPKGKQSEKQIDFQLEIERAGGIYVVARGVEDVIDLG